jgi:lipopolysaccharide biosynthesis protein
MRTLYLKDSSNRKKQFALTTRICVENGKKVVIKEPCFPEGIEHIKRIAESQKMFAKYYKNVKTSKTWIKNDMLYAEYINGVPLSDFYLKAIQNNDRDEIIRLLEFHLELALGRDNTCVFKTTEDFVKVFGEINSFEGESALKFTFFDPLPENIIFINGDINRPCFIDYEWFFDFPVPDALLKFRIIQQLSMLSGIERFISLDERLDIINCELSFDKGIIFFNKFSDFVYKEEKANYQILNKNFERKILQYPDINDFILLYYTLYFDTGNGYSENEKYSQSFTRNKVEIFCPLPENTVTVRLDPVESYGCVIGDLEIISYGGIMKYEPMNGFKNDNGDIVFVNTDPIIEITEAMNWIKIKYRILPLSEFSHYRIFDNYIATYQERNGLIVERNGLATERDNLIAEHNNLVAKYPDLSTQNCTLFFDTGNGYSVDKTQGYPYIGNEVDITCRIPENTVAVRFDPVEGYGCIISNLEVLSYNGIVMYEPINGYKNENGDMVFTTIDPQIELQGVMIWLKIKYRIQFLSEFSQYQVFDSYIITCQERNGLITERDGLVTERDGLVTERDGLVTERDGLVTERDGLVTERNGLVTEQNGLISERNALIAERDSLVSERTWLTAERYNLINERDGLLNSRSWRFAKLLRDIGDFIRRHKVLYLFAKGILSIKRNGIKETLKKVVSFNRRALLSHRIDLAYESEYQDNKDFSKYEPKVKTIAFYLPQFHAIPENDKWWGKGFTEWTNTRKAKPMFEEHYQPHEPHKDFGYYNLTNVTTLKKQAVLAKQHGIYGFCFYLYWFSGKRLLEKPLDLFLDHPEIDINFCLCWANENWTKRWDGLDSEILMKQNYSDDDPLRFIEDIQKYIVDKRYIRIDGIPVILVYNPGHIPNVRDVFVKWKNHAEEIGIGKIKIWICKTFGHTQKTLHIEDVVDGLVEFPPHSIPPVGAKNINLGENTANIYDYKEVVSEIKREFASENRIRESSDSIPLYRTCMMGWDNAARKKNGWSTFAGFSLKSFFDWTSLLVAEVLETSKSIFFVNAWNEWAEGTYLEPDKKFGYANINTLSMAIFGLPFYVGHPIVHKKYKKINNYFLQKNNVRICIQVHLYHIDLIDEIITNLNYIPFQFHCFISTDTDEKINIIQNKFERECKNACGVYISRFENRGRDVAPFIEQMNKNINNYEYILHIHSKKSLTSDGYGDEWRKYLFKHLLGSTENIYHIFTEFTVHKDLGLIFPPTFGAVIPHMLWGTDIQQGKKNVQDFLERIDVPTSLGDEPEFAAGNMFWARVKSIKKVFDADIGQNDFPTEDNQKDMTLAHAIERSWVYIAKDKGYTFKRALNTDLVKNRI